MRTIHTKTLISPCFAHVERHCSVVGVRVISLALVVLLGGSAARCADSPPARAAALTVPVGDSWTGRHSPSNNHIADNIAGVTTTSIVSPTATDAKYHVTFPGSAKDDFLVNANGTYTHTRSDGVVVSGKRTATETSSEISGKLKQKSLYDGVGNLVEVTVGDPASPAYQRTTYTYSLVLVEQLYWWSERKYAYGNTSEYNSAVEGVNVLLASRQLAVKGVAGIDTAELVTRMTYVTSPGKSFGRVKTTTDAAGGVTKYTYDSSGNLDTMTDVRGKIWTYGNYTAFGQPKSITSPKNRQTTTTYFV